jgi:hypothetical protein
MLGVLRGTHATRGTVTLYALSGEKQATAAWAAPIDLQEVGGVRTIPNFKDPATGYDNASNPFSTGIGDSFYKFGKCAATTLLGNALALNLKDIEMAEVWLEMRDPAPTDADYPHLNEIGSCEQCRRYLGRMLCEAGP